MNKSDLKDGMVIKYKDGTSRVCLNGGLWTEYGIAVKAENINNDLKSSISSEFDIDRIFYNNKLIWKREEIDWNKVPVGAKVAVSDNEVNWYDAIFIDYMSNENINDGKLYFKVADVKSKQVHLWKYCKLAEKPKEEVTFDDIDKKLDFYCINHNKICDQACGPCVTKNILENYNVTRKDNK